MVKMAYRRAGQFLSAHHPRLISTAFVAQMGGFFASSHQSGFGAVMTRRASLRQVAQMIGLDASLMAPHSRIGPHRSQM